MIPFPFQTGGLGLVGEPGSSSGGADPFYANVVSLLHFDGADGSTTFTDEKGVVWTASGNAQIDTSESKFGGSSLLLDGVNDMITAVSSAIWGFGTADWTVECFMRRVNSGGVIWDNRLAGGQPMVAFTDASGFICFYDGSTKTGTGVVAANTWHHVAWCRVASTLRMFVDGVQAFSSAYANNMDASRPMRIGQDIANNADFQGWIDEWRVTKGVGRYTGAFTPPTAAFPNF